MAMRLRLPNFEPFAAPSNRVVGEPKGDGRDRGQHYDLCLGAALARNPGLIVMPIFFALIESEIIENNSLNP